jgi:hypothetical protein
MMLPWIGALPVGAVHQHRRVSGSRMPPTNDGQQAVLERLLEQDQEDQQPDGRHEQARSAPWRCAASPSTRGTSSGGHRRRTLRDKVSRTSPELPATGRRAGGALPRRRDEAAWMTYPVALYLQDAHDHHARVSSWCGTPSRRASTRSGRPTVGLVRDAVVPMAAFAAGTDRIKVGSGVIDIWTRNAARLASTFSTLDDLAPGQHHLRARCMVGSARLEGRRQPRRARCG